MSDAKKELPGESLDDFIRLSAMLLLLLHSRKGASQSIIAVVCEDQALSGSEVQKLELLLEHLVAAYQRRRRRLGPPAVIHLVRAAWLLAHVGPCATIDIAVCLAHDLREDLALPSAAMLRDLDFSGEDAGLLEACVDLLTRRPEQTYHQYLSRLLDGASEDSGLVRIKIADRLDNSLDLRLELTDPLRGVDYHEVLYRICYLKTMPAPLDSHPEPQIDGARRLAELYKNFVFLSMIRERGLALGHRAERLYHALALASAKEAQLILVHLVRYHVTEPGECRLQILEALDYVGSGGINRVTPPSNRPLDGFFSTFMDHSPAEPKKARLARLYQGKRQMLQAAVAFEAIARKFLIDPAYYIHGLGENGLLAKG